MFFELIWECIWSLDLICGMNYNREERTKWVWKGKEAAGPFAYLAKPCAWWPRTVPLGLKSSAQTLISACLQVNVLLCWSRCGASKVLVLVCVDLHGWLQLYSVWVCVHVCVLETSAQSHCWLDLGTQGTRIGTTAKVWRGPGEGFAWMLKCTNISFP